MKKKKILARIGAIVACVLLVGALAIPAFADEPTETQDIQTTVPLGTAQQLFETMIGTAKNNAYDNLYSRYLGYGDNRFFTMDYLVSGQSSSFSASIPFDLNVGEDNTTIFAQIPVDMISYVFYTNSNAPAYINAFDGGQINVQIYANDIDGYRLSVAYVAEGEMAGKFVYVFRGLTQDALTLESLTVEGNLITPTYTNANVAFTIARASSEWSPMLTTFCSVLFDNSTPVQLDNVLFSPKQFYYGIDQSYNLGYNDGYRYGYSNGYAEGYEVGLDEGYSNGVNTDSYQAGYNQALSEIESGDYGRNFIGGILRAPMDMLRNFTLIEWTTNTGTEVVINLATLFTAVISVSLFIWFLKLFAGG